MLKMTRMTRSIGIFGLFFFLQLMFVWSSEACTRILWNTIGQAVLVARSMDWSASLGERVVLYPRGMKMQGWPGKNAATWVSKYGSVAVVPYAFSESLRKGLDRAPDPSKGADPLVDGSSEGMNERGLAVHMLALMASEYGKPDAGKPRVHPARLLRYILDNCCTVTEALADLQTIQVVPVAGEAGYPQHMALDDVAGDSAIVEFIDGRVEVHHGREFTVLTNDPPYPDQLANCKRYKTFGGSLEELPGGVEPLDRFVRAAAFLKTLPEPTNKAEAVAYLFGVIRNVAVPFGAVYRSLPGTITYPTWWTSVSDLNNKIFYLNMARSLNVIWVNLNMVDFAAGNPMRVLDPGQIALEGDVTNRFQPVSASRTRSP